jgi:hypothetical protein
MDHLYEMTRGTFPDESRAGFSPHLRRNGFEYGLHVRVNILVAADHYARPMAGAIRASGDAYAEK